MVIHLPYTAEQGQASLLCIFFLILPVLLPPGEVGEWREIQIALEYLPLTLLKGGVPNFTNFPERWVVSVAETSEEPVTHTVGCCEIKMNKTEQYRQESLPLLFYLKAKLTVCTAHFYWLSKLVVTLLAQAGVWTTVSFSVPSVHLCNWEVNSQHQVCCLLSTKSGLQLFFPHRRAAELLIGALIGQPWRKDHICHQLERLAFKMRVLIWSCDKYNREEAATLLLCLECRNWIVWKTVFRCICNSYLPQVLLCQVVSC